jgi:hypothetical protein
MNSSVDDEAKNRALKRIAERIAEESENLPFRWGYFQGVALVMTMGTRTKSRLRLLRPALNRV